MKAWRWSHIKVQKTGNRWSWPSGRIKGMVSYWNFVPGLHWDWCQISPCYATELHVSVNGDHQLNWLSQAVIFDLNKWKAWLEPRTNQGCPPGVQCCAYKRKGQSPKGGTVNHRQNLALSAQSTRTLQHQEGLSRAPRWLEEARGEEQRNKRRWELKIDGMRL